MIITSTNAKAIGESLRNTVANNIEIMNLYPLATEDSYNYFRQKQQLAAIHIEPDLSEKLLFLSQGRPILLDLAVEWVAYGITIDWVADLSLKDLSSLEREEQRKLQKEFEKVIVGHFSQLRSPIEMLILLMSYIYPINVKMIFQILQWENAQELMNEALSYVFVKQLPNGYIKLHDEMERLIHQHVWPTIDPEGGRRRWYSERFSKYIIEEIRSIEATIADLKRTLSAIEKERSIEESIEISLKLEELDQHLWALKEQQFKHTLLTNLGEGIKLFTKLFDEATKHSLFILRQRLFNSLKNVPKSLFSLEQAYLFDIYHTKLLFDEGKYIEAQKLCKQMSHKEGISVDYQVETLLSGSKQFCGRQSLPIYRHRQDYERFQNSGYRPPDVA